MFKEEIAFNRGYRVSEEGHLSNPRGIFVSGCVRRDGYIQFTMRHQGKFLCVYVHRLQAYQKYGERILESGIKVRHLNSNPLDNSIKNIALGTHSDNMMDMPRSLRISKASKASLKYDRAEVRGYYQQHGFTKTMKFFGITSKGTLHYILKKRTLFSTT